MVINVDENNIQRNSTWLELIKTRLFGNNDENRFQFASRVIQWLFPSSDVRLHPICLWREDFILSFPLYFQCLHSLWSDFALRGKFLIGWHSRNDDNYSIPNIYMLGYSLMATSKLCHYELARALFTSNYQFNNNNIGI